MPPPPPILACLCQVFVQIPHTPQGQVCPPPPPLIPLSSLQPVSVYLMYASTCMKQTTWTPRHQHEAYSSLHTHFTACQSQLNHFQVVQPLEAGKPQLWLLRRDGPKTTRWITGDCKLLLIPAERPVHSEMLSELSTYQIYQFNFSLTWKNVDTGNSAG